MVVPTQKSPLDDEGSGKVIGMYVGFLILFFILAGTFFPYAPTQEAAHAIEFQGETVKLHCGTRRAAVDAVKKWKEKHRSPMIVAEKHEDQGRKGYVILLFLEEDGPAGPMDVI